MNVYEKAEIKELIQEVLSEVKKEKAKPLKDIKLTIAEVNRLNRYLTESRGKGIVVCKQETQARFQDVGSYNNQCEFNRKNNKKLYGKEAHEPKLPEGQESRVQGDEHTAGAVLHGGQGGR